MRPRLTTIVAAAVIAFLLATNPLVGEAAGMITGRQIKDGTVTGRDIKDHSLTSTDVSGLLAGPVGPVGPRGAQGIQGVPGNTGPAGLSNKQEIVSDPITITSNSTGLVQAGCPSNTTLLGGGFYSNAGVTVSQSRPASGLWTVVAINNTGASAILRAYAECATVQP